jgi:hypothetical protein
MLHNFKFDNRFISDSVLNPDLNLDPASVLDSNSRFNQDPDLYMPKIPDLIGFGPRTLLNS